MIRVDLPRFDRFEAWRDAARHLVGAGIAPDRITWADPDAPADLFGSDPMPPAGNAKVKATKDYLSLARTVASHSDPERWSLIYAALWRAQSDRGFLDNPADPLMDRLNRLAKSVRRDIHKMHAFVRFHELPSDGPRRSFGAWEGDHHQTAILGQTGNVARDIAAAHHVQDQVGPARPGQDPFMKGLCELPACR